MRSLKQLAYVGTAFAFGLALVGCGFPMSNVDQKPTSLAQEEQTSSQIEGKSSDDTTTIKDGEDATKDDTLIGGKEASDAKKGETEQDDTKESKRESLPVHKGSLAVGVEEDGSPVVAEETMRSLICITLQEESFELPIAMEDLLARGWEVESFADEGTLIEPVQGLKSIPLHVKGDPRSKIEVDVLNLSDEACLWDKAHCMGFRVRGEDAVRMSSAAGFGTDSTFDDVRELLGVGNDAWRSGSQRSANLKIYVGEGDEHIAAGEVSYVGKDGEDGLSELYVCLTAVKDRSEGPESQGRPGRPDGPGGPGEGMPGRPPLP